MKYGVKRLIYQCISTKNVRLTDNVYVLLIIETPAL